MEVYYTMSICTVSKNTGLTQEAIMFLEEISVQWRGQGCLLGRDGLAHYVFEPKAEIASEEEMKQAYEKVESLYRRLLDLNKIFEVAKFVHQSRNQFILRTLDQFYKRFEALERETKKLKEAVAVAIEANERNYQRIKVLEGLEQRFEQLDTLIKAVSKEDPGGPNKREEPDPLAGIKGRVSRRLLLSLRNAFLYDHISKPIEELTDSELLKIRNFGEKSLAEFRSIIPSPSYKEEVEQ
jgi:tetratricopeptide (TPR) repeat protein